MKYNGNEPVVKMIFLLNLHSCPKYLIIIAFSIQYVFSRRHIIECITAVRAAHCIHIDTVVGVIEAQQSAINEIIANIFYLRR